MLVLSGSGHTVCYGGKNLVPHYSCLCMSLIYDTAYKYSVKHFSLAESGAAQLDCFHCNEKALYAKHAMLCC